MFSKLKYGSYLAEHADVSARFISFLETGRRQPSLSALHALRVGLGIRIRNLADEVEVHFDAPGLPDPMENNTK